MPAHVITSPLSLARLLWWYGEDDLWPLVLAWEPRVVADLAEEFGRLHSDSSELGRIWPGHPGDAYLLMPVIARLEGSARPAALRRRRPSMEMPEVLNRYEDARWGDPGLVEVSRIVDERMSGKA